MNDVIFMNWYEFTKKRTVIIIDTSLIRDSVEERPVLVGAGATLEIDFFYQFFDSTYQNVGEDISYYVGEDEKSHTKISISDKKNFRNRQRAGR